MLTITKSLTPNKQQLEAVRLLAEAARYDESVARQRNNERVWNIQMTQASRAITREMKKLGAVKSEPKRLPRSQRPLVSFGEALSKALYQNK